MIELLAVILGPLFFMPLLTRYYAYSHGRPFWRWFLVGCVLPYFSLLLVAWTVHRDQRSPRPTGTAPTLGEPTAGPNAGFSSSNLLT